MMLTKELAAETLYNKLKDIDTGHPACDYTLERCKRLVPIVNEIQHLKAEKKALILAHSYVHPDIVYTVADHVGDSYGLAKNAKETEAEIIVFPSVRFMAETAKILNPSKMVIDPNPNGGCSLADSITGEDVRKLKQLYPEHSFICYVNTTAEVKAECDVCVTSSNVYKIAANYPNDKLYFLPDKLMGQNVIDYLRREKIDKEFLFWDGTCYVHEEYQPEQIDLLKQKHRDLTVIAHPECAPNVIEKADVIDSTSGMIDYVKKHASEEKSFALLTECGITSRLQVECPKARVIGSCMLCRYMRSNSLERIASALRDPKQDQIIEITQETQVKALKCVEEMFKYA